MAGASDLARAASRLAARLPGGCEPLARLAYNYAWSWSPANPFPLVDAGRWDRCGQNPVRLLQEAPLEALEAAASRPLPDLIPPPSEIERPVAFFCAEYGVHVSLPIYSGGLGALAGDLLKEASDRALPMVAIGLLYRQGYFRQRIDRVGWQTESWVDTDPERLPAALVTDGRGSVLTVTVPIGREDVVAQIWRVDVGRVPLFLLDTDRPENSAEARWITSRLYVGDQDVRLAQYALLGVGGVRALDALGIEASVLHLNEGHAALATIASDVPAHFTTHTPVPAGNDVFGHEAVASTLGRIAEEYGVGVDGLVRLGRTWPDDGGEPMGVSQLALRRTRSANGVSRRHGEVAREMWSAVGRDIGHVTNGVHLPTWVGPPMRALLERVLGEGWLDRTADESTWAALDDVSDEELWAMRCEQRASLVRWLRGRVMGDRLGREDGLEYARAAGGLEEDALTIGFARRVARYKRLGLLLQDPARAVELLGSDRPIQLVVAGKAHPRDDDAKRTVTELFRLKGAPAAAGRVAYLDDYDLATAARLVQGCDVWINVPRPPLEASGTSGMKNAVNGGLHLSVLDGWWSEAYDGENGWALPGEVWGDHEAQDQRDAAELLRLLEDEVVPSFYDRDERGVPPGWLRRMRASLRTLPPRFSATRMLAEYSSEIYGLPAGSEGRYAAQHPPS